jgi:prepilin-type processing-associated H-X9-DG protein
VRRAAARSQCANNLKQIALACHNCADTYTYPQEGGREGQKGMLPAGTVFNSALPPEHRLSWFVDLLPFVEQNNLYRGFNRNEGWDAPANRSAAATPLKVFWCPDWGREAAPDPSYLSAYVGVAGLGADAASLPTGDRNAGVFGHDRRTALAVIADGTSNTLLVLESARDNGPWSRGGFSTVRGLVPEEQPYLGVGRPFGGTHFAENTVFGRGESLGCNVAMADGSVHFLVETTAPHVLEALATVAGGELLPPDW